MSLPRCVVLLPVKSPEHAKSRLAGLGNELRRLLAEAFALDTAEAALRTPGVVAVLAITDDSTLIARLAGLGCLTTPDPTPGDLNAALRHAGAEAGRRWPRTVPVALCADLPALRPEELAIALETRGDSSWFVPDAATRGTTIYAAPSQVFRPRFGPSSGQDHRRDGARATGEDLWSLRLDVDTPEDLILARRLGLGPRTTAVLPEG